MNRCNRIISAILTICVLLSMAPGFLIAAYADTLPVYISVTSYNAGTLKISWNSTAPVVDQVFVIYHMPDIDNETAIAPPPISVPVGTNTAEITGLRNDFIYDINVQMISNGVVVAEGLLYFLPGITFSADIINEPIIDTNPPGYNPPYDPKGGREIGTKPRLNLKWKTPRVFNGSTARFTDAASSLTYMQDLLNVIYKQSKVLSKLDYRINISTQWTDMSLTDAVMVDGVTSKAHVSGYEADTATISVTGDTRSLDLLGRGSASDALPVTSGSTLGHRDILPGTVYYMNIQPVFQTFTNAVLVHQGATPLQGKTYTYTPIRFQLSKDEANNMYAKVYTINQGSLQLPDLYYEVQSNTVDTDSGWLTKAKIDPDYFRDANGQFQEFGIIPIIGISPNNNIYYRIVATSNSSDLIKSQSMPYRMSQDTARPPIPKGVAVIDRTLVTSGIKKSTDVKLTWDKPLNWEQIKSNTDPDNDVYFCITLNTSQTEVLQEPYPVLEEEDGTTYPAMPVKYRLVRYINARSVLSSGNDRIVEAGNRLEYTLKGFELFQWTDEDGTLQPLPDSLKPEAAYPTFLLSNRVYYMQIYTVKGDPANTGSTSEKSVTTSFTTLSGREKDVPLPTNFMLGENGNTYTQANGEVINTVKVQFDTIGSLQWKDFDSSPQTTADNKVFYDLYMSSNTTTFTRIGSTDPGYLQNNVQFDVVNDAQKQYVIATIRNFAPATEGQTSFGNKLKANTAYFFRIKTRLAMPAADPDERISEFTQILPVTTAKGDVQDPDDTQRYPLSPDDFDIAKDANGNLVLTGSTAAFTWNRKENDVTYTIICTSTRLPMDADETDYTNDPVYQDFKQKFSLPASAAGISLDPGAQTLPPNLEYNNNTRTLVYKIDKFLFPNRLYYFSIRAERKQPSDKTSAWICIPVTTLMIEAPANLEPVNGAELGFYWTDTATNAKAEDFTISVKGPKDKNYRQLTRAQSMVVKDQKTITVNGTSNHVYYGRVYNLDRNTAYSIRVYKGANNSTLVYQKDGVSTRNGFREIMVKWKGKTAYQYELAIKTADAAAYTTLTNTDLEIYTDIEGNSNPYYIEENTLTSANEYSWFYARIKTAAVALPDGTVDRLPIKSNSKYFIKVRAMKVDTMDTTLVAYSKYIGPAETRTEFSQDDYDHNEDEKNKEVTFLDRIKELEKAIFWRMGIGRSTANKVFLKGDRVLNAIQNTNHSLIIDLSELDVDLDSDEIYLPASIVKTLASEKKSLVVKTLGAEFALRPDTLDAENMIEFTNLKTKAGVKELFVKLMVARVDYPAVALPAGAKAVSGVNDFKVQIIGSSRTDANLKDLFKDKLYNTETGLVKKKLDVIKLPYNSNLTGTGDKLDEYMEDLVGDLESELSDYVQDVVEGTSGVSGMIIGTELVREYGAPLSVKLLHSGEAGFKVPYVQYQGTGSWQKLVNEVVSSQNTVTFQAGKPGKYMILLARAAADDIGEEYWAKEYIDTFLSKYDISDVFTGVDKSFNPESSVSVKEIILLYEKVTTGSGRSSGQDLKQKAKGLGLGGILNASAALKDVSREETAAVLVQLYAFQTGLSAEHLKPGRTIFLTDEKDVGDSYSNKVMYCIDRQLFTLDDQGRFKPKASITRAQLITVFVKTLDLTE
jgi:hypothetical protein